jgi:hypothetical protein
MKMSRFNLLKTVAIAVFSALWCAQSASAQGNGFKSWWERELCPGAGAFGGDSVIAGSVSFNHDVFFGNYTIANAGIAVNDAVDVTFYSILWHTDFFSQGTLNGGVNGTGLWTEFGGGLNFKGMDGAFNFNPQIGVLNGSLLSGFPGGGVPRAFEGIVPNLTSTYETDFLESELYAGYYIATTSRDDGYSDFIHWWYNAGIKPWGDCNDWKSVLSTGLHYEYLRNTGGVAPGQLYQWLGPYFQVALPNGLSLRYTAGWNLDDGFALGSDFYKVNLVYSF